tara:strand:- start:5148 stop:7700 length:2553 start_codon:yes stop_codon:yes gene_type:complete
MDNLSTFTDAYLNTGNSLLLELKQIDDSNVANYAKGLPPMTPEQIGALAATDAEKPGTEATANPGKLYKTAADPEKPDKTIEYAYGQSEGKGSFPGQQSFFVTDEAGWQFLVGYYQKNSDLVGNETGEPTDEKTPEAVAGMDPNGPPEENEKLLRAEAEQLCTDMAEACEEVAGIVDAAINRDDLPEKARENMGCDDSKAGGPGTKFCNDMVGLNSKGRMSKFSREGGETAQERIDNARAIAEQRIAAYKLSGKILTTGFDPEKDLTPEDLQLLSCLKMRGTGNTRGVWISGGEGCEGVIAALATGDGLTGDERYGIMIGNQNTALYRAMKAAQEKNFEVGEGDDKKNLIHQGTDESGLINWYNATFGRINEQLASFAMCLAHSGPKGMSSKQKSCAVEAVKAVVAELGGNAGFQKMYDMVGEKLEDPESEFEYGSIIDKGAEEKAVEVVEWAKKNGINLGDDEERALKIIAYLLTQGVKRWEGFADTMPPGSEVLQMGTKRAGVDKDGNIDNADVIVKMPGGSAEEEEHLDEMTNDPLFAVTEEQCPGRDDGEGMGVSVKEKTASNKEMAAGSRSIEGTSREEAGIARDNAKCYAGAVCENHKKAGKECGLEDGWEEREAEYRQGLEDKVDVSINALATMTRSTLNSIQQDNTSRMSYEDAQNQAEFWNDVDEWKNEEDPAKKKNLESKLRNRMMTATQAKDFEDDKPGVREMLMIDALFTGGSSRDQAFVQTSQSGATRVARESDLIGTAAFKFMTSAKEDVNFAQGSVSVKGVGRFARRLKGANEDGTGGTNKQFFNIEAGYVEEHTRELEPGESPVVGNSSMKAEDFVRKLQELFQGIDEILPVKN